MTGAARHIGNPPLQHPGPKPEPRLRCAPTPTRGFDITLKAGDLLEPVVLDAFAKAGLDSGYVGIPALACERMDYVIPARSQTPERLAWYSSPCAPEGPAHIAQGFMSVGQYKGAGFTHCHGIWTLADGTISTGHLLSQKTVVAQACTLRATGFTQARFERLPDAETGFEIFAALGAEGPAQTAPVPVTSPQALILTLRPNTDLTQACAQICAAHQIRDAQIVGLGSLNGAVFRDTSRMRDYVSEFVIREGTVNNGEVTLDLAVIDSHANLFLGPVQAGGGCVSVTAELVIIPSREGRL